LVEAGRVAAYWHARHTTEWHGGLAVPAACQALCAQRFQSSLM
jgi:hypothetical protein